MNKKVIITGILGQDGSYMSDYLLENTDYDIYGMMRRSSNPNYSNLELALKNNRFHLIIGDLSDSQSMHKVVEKYKPDYFINFAAQSFVASSWDLPEQTMDINSTGVMRCLESIVRFAPDCKFYNAGCYDSKTKIVTKEGIKFYNEVKEGDLVWSLNLLTRQIELKPIIKKINKYFEGKMIHFKGKGKDLLVTTNHNMIYEDKRTDKLFVKSAEKCREMAKFTFPRGKWCGIETNKIIDLSKFIPNKKYNKKTEITQINSEDLFYLIGLYIGDGSCNIIEHQNLCYNKEARYENRSEDGRFPTENHLKSLGLAKTISTYKCPRIYLDIPKSDKSWERITECLNRVNLKWSHHTEIDIYFASWGLYNYFNKCGHKSWEKRIPKEYLNVNKNLLEKLLQGILDSDGHRNRVVT